jgi:hypothetical protein
VQSSGLASRGGGVCSETALLCAPRIAACVRGVLIMVPHAPPSPFILTPSKPNRRRQHAI